MFAAGMGSSELVLMAPQITKPHQEKILFSFLNCLTCKGGQAIEFILKIIVRGAIRGKTPKT